MPPRQRVTNYMLPTVAPKQPTQHPGRGVALSALATHRTCPCGLKQLPPSLTQAYRFTAY
ncbi:MAG: hypothetical protein ACK50M_16045 [Cyclobacteriaceae bacterium]